MRLHAAPRGRWGPQAPKRARVVAGVLSTPPPSTKRPQLPSSAPAPSPSASSLLGSLRSWRWPLSPEPAPELQLVSGRRSLLCARVRDDAPIRGAGQNERENLRFAQEEELKPPFYF